MSLKIADLPMNEIAQQLGGKVTFYPDRDHACDVVTPTCRLYFRIDSRKPTQVQVSISAPTYRDARGELQTIELYKLLTEDEANSGKFFTHIGCGISKSAEHIARDVTRRLLAPWGDVLPRIQQEIDKHNDYVTRHDERVARFVNAFKYDPRERGGETLYSHGNGLPNIRVNPSGVCFHDYFYCSEEAAMKILEILKADKGRE